MKPILVPIDFSESSENAAKYALRLAKYLKANIKLCHAMYVPSAAATAGQVAWPLYEYSAIEEDTRKSFIDLIGRLDEKGRILPDEKSFRPSISHTSEMGIVTDVVSKFVKEIHSNLVVMGMSGIGGIPKLLLGSTSRSMIERAEFPVLLIPSGYAFKEIKKIAFATDLREDDIEVIHSLAGFARHFDAELVIVYINSGHHENTQQTKKTDLFLNNITCKINYEKIYFRRIDNDDVNKGLDWLSEQGLINVLVMVHRHLGFLERFFKGSYTKKQADNIKIPLMVLPEGLHPVF